MDEEFVGEEVWAVKNTEANRYYKGSISNTKEAAQQYLEYILSREKGVPAEVVKVILIEADEWENPLEKDEEEEPSEIVGGLDDH